MKENQESQQNRPIFPLKIRYPLKDKITPFTNRYGIYILLPAVVGVLFFIGVGSKTFYGVLDAGSKFKGFLRDRFFSVFRRYEDRE